MVGVSRRRVLAALGSLAGLAPLTGCGGPGFRDGWRVQAPIPASTIATAMPRFTQLEAPDGTMVYLASRPELATVRLELVLDAGARREPAGRGGLADILVAMLHQGTCGGGRAALAAALGDLGGDLYVAADHQCLRVGTQVLAGSAAAALTVLGDVVCRPTLPASALERLRAGLTKPRPSTAATLARLAAFEALSVGASPMANLRRSGQAASIEDVRAMLTAGLTRLPRAVIVAGGFEPEPTPRWIRDTIARLPLAGKGSGRVPYGAGESQPERVVLVDRPGGAAVVSLGTLAPAEGHADEVAFELAAAVMGAELHAALREREGLVYGVEAAIEPTPVGRMLQLSLAVDPQLVAGALRHAVRSLESVREHTISSAWVEQVRTRWLVATMSRLQTSEELVDGARWLHLHERPGDYYQRTVDQLDQVDGEDVARMLRSRFDRDAVVLVLVGPLRGLRDAVARVLPGAPAVVMSEERLVGSG